MANRPRPPMLDHLIEVLDDTKDPLTAQQVADALNDGRFKNIGADECEMLLIDAANCGRIRWAPEQPDRINRFLAPKRLFPETGHPLKAQTRPPSSIWEWAKGERHPWGCHREPKEESHIRDKPSKCRVEKPLPYKPVSSKPRAVS